MTGLLALRTAKMGPSLRSKIVRVRCSPSDLEVQLKDGSDALLCSYVKRP